MHEIIKDGKTYILLKNYKKKENVCTIKLSEVAMTKNLSFIEPAKKKLDEKNNVLKETIEDHIELFKTLNIDYLLDKAFDEKGCELHNYQGLYAEKEPWLEFASKLK